ncbi:MAG: hypothetical protein AAGA93_27870 [Actinomycetota bacterium]
MRFPRPRSPRRTPGGLRSIAVIGTLAWLTLAGCSGERPTLVQPTTTAPPLGSVAPTTVPLPERADCATTTGPGPARALLIPEVVPCVAVAAHHRIRFVNQGFEQAELIVGQTTLLVPAGGEQVSEPAGALLASGPNRILAGEATVATVWLVDPAENPLAGSEIGLTSVGPVELGQGPAEVTAAVGGPPVPAAGSACYLSTLDGDPYSPLFTFRDGQLVVVQVFTPGLSTLSGISVGSTSGEIAAAYGDRVETRAPASGDPGRQLVVFLPTDEDDQVFRLVFDLTDDVVTSVRFGATEIVADQPGCGP